MSLHKNKRILDVFVSSTQKDLVQNRKIAVEEIRAAGHRAIAMEFFDAQDKPSNEFIADCIAKCDVYVIILGRNFGSTIDGQSYVEFEYKKAVEHHKPILAFVPHDDEVRRSEMAQALIDFRSSIMDHKGRQVSQYYFEARDEFRSQFNRSLGNLAKDLEEVGRGGWIRNEELNEYIHVSKIPPQLTRSETLRELIDPICSFTELFPNIDSDVDEKTCISRFLWRMLATSITAEKGIRRLFLDGGSTTLFACKEFNEFCGVNAAIHGHKTNRKLTIGTNSILNLIELSSGIQGPIRPYKDLVLFPPPPVNSDFGKTYGAVASITPQTVMQYHERGWTFRDPMQKLQEATQDFKDWLNQDGGSSLAVLSAAGFLSDGDHLGPWVKSHPSMLLQSCIFRTGTPVVLILDGAKWNAESGEQQAYHVLVDDLNFSKIVQENPFAMAIGTLIEEKAILIKKYFEDIGMRVLNDEAKKTRDPRPVYRLLAYNQHFAPLTR